MSRRVVGFVLASPIVLATVAMAEEETHHHAEGTPWASLFFSTVNLLIFLWILARFALPAVRGWVRDRRDKVVSALEAAAAAKAEAEKLRAEWQARLAEIHQTIETLRMEARRDAERERERILAAAYQTAETIRRDAERTAAYELRRTQAQLRAELARQALRLAEESVRAHWSAADQQRFVAEFIKQVEP